jgi:hypothetical protein
MVEKTSIKREAEFEWVRMKTHTPQITDATKIPVFSRFAPKLSMKK